MMNALDKLNGRSILVIANYRTGSTALCDLLSKHTGYHNLDEYFHPTKNSENFKTLLNKKIIVKIMPDHPVGNNWGYLLENFFILGITRRDVIAQITSFYICHRTHTWHSRKNCSNAVSSQVSIDHDDLENQCRYITNMNLQYQQLKKHCEIELIYEDVQHEFNESNYERYPKPTNYNQIESSVQQFLISEQYL